MFCILITQIFNRQKLIKAKRRRVYTGAIGNVSERRKPYKLLDKPVEKNFPVS